MSQSQFYQDILALQDIYDFKEDGFFVDIGAYDGIYLSNTYMMEKQFGWDGICVEPVPYLFRELKKVRNCKAYNVACGKDKSIEVPKVFQYVPVRKRKSFMDYDVVYSSKSKETVEVPCWTLQQVLETGNAPHFIEYLSIDTDGYDFDIIQSVSLSQYSFGVINIEHNGKSNEIKNYLEPQGYTLTYTIGVDNIYLNNSIIEKGYGTTFAKTFLAIPEDGYCPLYPLFRQR